MHAEETTESALGGFGFGSFHFSGHFITRFHCSQAWEFAALLRLEAMDLTMLI